MARKRKRKLKLPDRAAVWLVLIIIVVAATNHRGTVAEKVIVISLAITVGCLYELLIGPSQCRVLKQGGGACHNNCRGRLHGCWIISHKRAKRAAIFQRITNRDLSPRSREPIGSRPAGVPGPARVAPSAAAPAYPAAVPREERAFDRAVAIVG